MSTVNLINIFKLFYHYQNNLLISLFSFFLFGSSTAFALLLFLSSFRVNNSPEYFLFSASNVFFPHQRSFFDSRFDFLHIPAYNVMIIRSREEFLVGKCETSDSIFMAIEFLEHLSGFNIPYLDCFIITPRKQFPLTDL